MTAANPSGGPDAVIAALEASRAVLGDAATDAAIAALRATQSAAAAPEHEAERKLVTVMFADASGFTALSERLGAEQIRTLINGCFGVLAPVIERAGGTIDKYIGDCVMALFGAPVAREDDAQRCLGAALDMMAALDGFNRDHGTAIGMHIGINTGEVIAGGIGGAGRQDYSVIGDAVNIAARLQDVAKTGEIFVGPDTARLAAAQFDFAPVDTLPLKGRERPVAVHRLLGRRRLGTDGAGDDGPTAGRDAEIARIVDAVRRGAERPGRLLVSGEPGIGKTRLLAQARRVAEPDAAFIVARAQASTTGTAYGLIADALGRLTDTRLEQGSAAFAANLAAACDARGGASFVPLAMMAGLAVEPDAARPFQGLAPAMLHRRFAAAYADFAHGAAGGKPPVLCFEDLHWADGASLNLIAQLSTLDAPPALVLMSARTDGVAALARAGLGWDEEVALAGLAVDEVDLLARRALGAAALDPALLRLLAGRSEGNPFFLEQLIATLRDADGIAIDGGIASLRPGTTRIAMPASLHGLVQARLDQLPKPAKRTLQAAAAVGRTFPVRLIEQIEARAGATAAETGGRLEDLAQRDLLRQGMAEARALAEQQYAFRHAAIQEVAYGTLLDARRKLIHRAIADALKAFLGDRGADHALTLAHHFRRAGDDAEAVAHYLDGAERAAAVYAVAEARVAYRRALDALDRTDPRSATEPARRHRIRALTGLGNIQERAGEHGAALTAFGEALALCGPAESLAAAGLHRRIGLSALAQRAVADAARSFDTALALLGPTRDAADPAWWDEWIEVQLERLWAAYFGGDLLQMQAVRDEAGALVAGHGTLSQRSRFGKRVLLIAFRAECLTISDATMAGARESLALSRQLDDPDDLARAHFMVGFTSMWRGDQPTAATHLPRALELARTTGNAEYEVMALSYLTVMHRKRGDIGAVREWRALAAARAEAAAMPLYVSIARANRAWLALRDGATDEVEALGAPLVAAWGTSPWQLTWLAAWPLLAARLDGGSTDLAAPVEAMLRPDQQRLGVAIDEPLRAAALLLAAGDTAAAVAALTRARIAAAAGGFC